MFGKQIAHLEKEYSAQIKWGKLANLVTPDCSEDIKDAMTTSYADWVSFVGTSFTTAGILGRYKAYNDAEDIMVDAEKVTDRQRDIGRFVRSDKKQGIVTDYASDNVGLHRWQCNFTFAKLRLIEEMIRHGEPENEICAAIQSSEAHVQAMIRQTKIAMMDKQP